jgi:hypothetical protein
MECLFLAQSFDTVRVPSWIEFAFFDAVPRSETHQGGANESAEESEADKKQQAPERKPKQAREFFGLNHFSSAQKGFAGPAPD